MMRMILSVNLTALLLAATPALAQRPLPVAPDDYGYTTLASGEPGCSYEYLDLNLSGEVLNLVASGSEPAGDDGGAELVLPVPFEFYGAASTALTVSSNGYVALAASLDDEDGGHWRADCPLPVIPDNSRARFGRIYALLDDLEQGSAGQLLWQHFEICPRASAVVDDEACSVVHWRNWRRLAGTDVLDFQVVLYHASMAIAIQYQQVAGPVLADATIGIQDNGAVSAALIGCAGSRPPQPKAAFCLFDPRYLPGVADELIFADGFEAGAPGVRR